VAERRKGRYRIAASVCCTSKNARGIEKWCKLRDEQYPFTL
jgi:hypothetical protein